MKKIFKKVNIYFLLPKIRRFMSLDYIYTDNSKIANQKHVSTYHDSKFAKNIQYEKDINLFF